MTKWITGLLAGALGLSGFVVNASPNLSSSQGEPDAARVGGGVGQNQDVWEDSDITYIEGDLTLSAANYRKWSTRLNAARGAGLATDFEHSELDGDILYMNLNRATTLVIEGNLVVDDLQVQADAPLLIQADDVVLRGNSIVAVQGDLAILANSFDGGGGVLLTVGGSGASGEDAPEGEAGRDASSEKPTYNCSGYNTASLSCSGNGANGGSGGQGTTGTGGSNGRCTNGGIVSSYPTAGSRGGTGQAGGSGGDGQDITVTVNDYYGGTFYSRGGTGGAGGRGGTGGRGGNAACCAFACANAQTGGNGGTGGTGGRGGNGGDIKVNYCVNHMNDPGANYTEVVNLNGGAGGSRGAGGTGGSGGSGCSVACTSSGSQGSTGGGGPVGVAGSRGTFNKVQRTDCP